MQARLIALLIGGACLLVPTISGAARPARVEGVYYLKIRTAPGFDAPERGTLAAGETVDIIDEVGRWARVRLPNGRSGYVSRKYLVLVGTPAGKPAATPRDADAGADRPQGPQKPQNGTAPGAPQPAEDGAAGVMGTGTATSAHRRDDHAGDATGAPAGDRTPSTALAPPSPRRSQPWTAARVEEVRTSLRELAAGQDRLSRLVEAHLATPTNGSGHAGRPDDSVLALTPRQVAFWLGVGYVVGWSSTMVVGRWRQRRYRHKVRL